jgi:hypothetical protein
MIIVDFIVFAALATLGALLARVALTDARPRELLALAVPLGGGILTWVMFLGSLLGLRLTPASCSAVWLVLMGLAGVGARWRNGRESGGTALDRQWDVRALPGALLVAVLLVVSCLIALGNSYSAWDGAAIWSIKGYGIAREGTVFAAGRYGSHGLAYPLNIPLLISLFALASGDVVPGSILLFPVFQASLLLAVLVHWEAAGVQRWMGWLGIGLLALIPALFEQATIGMANVPMTAYLVLGALYAVQGVFQGRRGAHTLSGILLGLACWTRVEGILLVAAVVAGVIAGRVLARRGTLRLAAWLLPILVIGGAWLVFYRLEGAEGAQATRAIDKLLDAWRTSGFGLAPARIMFGYLRRSLFAPGIWGAVFPALAVLFLYGIRTHRMRADPAMMSLLLAGVAAGAATLVIFFVGSYISSGLFGWMTRGFPREFLTTPVLLTVGAIQAAGAQWEERGRRPAGYRDPQSGAA